MRHTRARRRFKSILVILLITSFVLFIEARINAFAPQLKDFAELKIEEAFDNKFKISIGRIGGGIIHPFTLSDCIIKSEKSNFLFSSLEVSNVTVNYRIWDFLFNRGRMPLISHLLASHPRIDAKFASKNNRFSGFVRVEGNIHDSKIKGYVNLSNEERVDFSGLIKDESFGFELKPKEGILKAEGSVSNDGLLVTNLKIAHLRLKDYDIVCDAVFKNRFVMDPKDPKASYIEGDTEAKNLVINYKPLSDIKSTYKISNRVLDISNFEFGNNFKGQGKVFLSEPHYIDIVATADNVSLGKILSDLNAQDSIKLSGIMNGKFKVKGPMENPKSSVRMEVRDGIIATVDFDYLTADLRGEGPIIRVEDSRITRESGCFVLAGEIDLSKAGRGNMFERIKIASSDTAILWDGWDTKQMLDVQEITMKKKMSEEIDLGFKKFVSDSKVDESVRDTDEYELGYNLNSNESLKFKIGPDQDFFGLEHRNKF